MASNMRFLKVRIESSKLLWYNYEKLCVRLEKQLENELEGQEGAEVLKKEFKEEEKGVRLSAIIGKEENIAVNDILLINTGN